jgi:hypothetical protein
MMGIIESIDDTQAIALKNGLLLNLFFSNIENIARNKNIACQNSFFLKGKTKVYRQLVLFRHLNA